MTFTVQCPDNCFQAAGVVYGADWGPKDKHYREGQTIYDSAGILGPYEDTSAICRAAILSGVGTNDDSFYTTFTIVKPLRKYQDPGGGKIEFYKWDRSDDCEGACPGKYESYRKSYVSTRCCKGGSDKWLGYENNKYLKFRNAFFNEWQNVRAFTIDGAVKNLCPPGFKFKKGSRKAGDPACVVSARAEYTPVAGCDECVEGSRFRPTQARVVGHARVRCAQCVWAVRDLAAAAVGGGSRCPPPARQQIQFCQRASKRVACVKTLLTCSSGVRRLGQRREVWHLGTVWVELPVRWAWPA